MEPSESAKAETPASQVAVFVGFAPGSLMEMLARLAVKLHNSI